MRLALFVGGELSHDRRGGLAARARDLHARRIVVEVRVGGLVEIREELVVLALRDRIVRMPVALHALEGHSHERLPSGRHAVEHGGHAELLVVGAALGVGERVAMERGCETISLGRVRHHVAGEHAHGELVVGHVGVERVDHPVTPRPDVASTVFLVTLRIGVAAEIKPNAGKTLAVGWTGQQRVDEFFVGVGRVVGKKRSAHIGIGGNSRQVERNSPRERLAISFGRKRETSLRKPRRYKSIDVMSEVAANRRHRRILARRERPMRPPLRTLLDPASDRAYLRLRKRRAFRRHAAIGIVREHAGEHRTLRRRARDHRDMTTLEHAGHARVIGEIQSGHLAHAAVATKAARGKGGKHLTRKIHSRRFHGRKVHSRQVHARSVLRHLPLAMQQRPARREHRGGRSGEDHARGAH